MILNFLVPFLTALITIPLFGVIAKKLNVVDRPDGYLKPHGRVVPYLGGLGMFSGMFYVLWKFSDIFIAVSLLLTVGLVDDIFSLSPRLRLFVEMATALLILFSLHVQGFWTVLCLLVEVVAIVNAVNMIDGLDGVCGGNVAISALFFFLIAQDLFSKQLALALIGVSLAYLVYNFPPAKIFMGDAGSYLLGANLAILYILTSRPLPSFRMISSIFPLWIYFLDLISGVIRRIRNKRSPFIGDRDHIYDKLKRRLHDSKKVALYTYLINVSFSVLIFANPVVGILLAMTFSYILVKLLNMLGYDG